MFGVFLAKLCLYRNCISLDVRANIGRFCKHANPSASLLKLFTRCSDLTKAEKDSAGTLEACVQPDGIPCV